ncbi:acetate kinase, partial [bacterium]|nr:acetate kinase [bacterium]
SEVESILNKESGLLGISGLTNDMREIIAEAEEHDDRRAKLAITMYCYRIRKYIGSYIAAIGNVQALIFTGGIGENSDLIRAKICEGLEIMGIKIDQDKNKELHGKEGLFSDDKSTVTLWSIPTNEELLIARDTVRCIEKAPLP